MTKDTDLPNRRPAPNSPHPNGRDHVPGSPQVRKGTVSPPHQDRQLGAKLSQPNFNQSEHEVTRAVPEVGIGVSSSENTGIEPPSEIPNSKVSRFKFLTSWPVLGFMTILISGGLGFVAIALLLKLPAVPNCPKIFWPTASASLRIYCAQLAANKQTADNLIEAINLINSLPMDHPLRKEINSHIEGWALDILKLGEESFQAGKLQESIDLAQQVPSNVPAYTLVKEQIEQWQSIWSKGEDYYQKAEQALRDSNWNQAFTEAVQITYLGNQYWATTKYNQLVDKIQLAREESTKLDKAFQLKKAGGLENILAAIKLAEQIPSESYAYKEAKDLITECGMKLVALGKEKLNQGDWRTVQEIAEKIPTSLNLQVEAEDLNTLATALSRAEEGTANSLEDAISIAQRLELGRPLRIKAQDLISRWQREIEDVAHLQRARDLAQPGSVGDLAAAIAEAEQVPSANPRYQEARAQIKNWINQIQTQQDRPFLERADQWASLGDVPSLQAAIEQARRVGRGRVLYAEAQEKIGQWTRRVQRIQDQPYLDQAEQLASLGDVPSLQEAVNQASAISRGRTLYPEAQGKIGQWTRRIQRLQDQPILDQALGLASAGNLRDAVATAEQIRSGRVLYDEAQTKVRSWRREIQAQDNLNQAFELAKSETAPELAAAIRLARKVSGSSSVADTAREAGNRWSYQLLALAQAKAAESIPDAIAIAKTIPAGTDAYNAAQMQVTAWQNTLQPPVNIQTLPIN